MTATAMPSAVAEQLQLDLSEQEVDQLARCEAVIERGKQTFLEVGSALMTIRENRLYRQTHVSFEAYTAERWNITARHANRLITATEIAEEMGPMGPILESERQARELTRYTPEQRKEAAENALEQAEGKPVTGKDVLAAAQTLYPTEPAPAPLPPPSAALQTFLGQDGEVVVPTTSPAEKQIKNYGELNAPFEGGNVVTRIFANEQLRVEVPFQPDTWIVRERKESALVGNLHHSPVNGLMVNFITPDEVTVGLGFTQDFATARYMLADEILRRYQAEGRLHEDKPVETPEQDGDKDPAPDKTQADSELVSTLDAAATPAPAPSAPAPAPQAAAIPSIPVTDKREERLSPAAAPSTPPQAPAPAAAPARSAMVMAMLPSDENEWLQSQGLTVGLAIAELRELRNTPAGTFGTYKLSVEGQEALQTILEDFNANRGTQEGTKILSFAALKSIQRVVGDKTSAAPEDILNAVLLYHAR